jgi:ribonuclease P protein component
LNPNGIEQYMLTFKKEERLCSRKVIQELYTSGKFFNSKCFRVLWMNHDLPEKFPAQVLLSVSKKKFKRAVDRNRIKRIMREAYRKNKQFFYDSLLAKNKKVVCAFSYIAADEMSYSEIETKLIVTLQRLQTELEKNH